MAGYLWALVTWGTPETRMTYGKPCSAGKPRVLQVAVSLTRTIYPNCFMNMNTLSWKPYFLMSVASFSRIMDQAKKYEWFRSGLRKAIAILRVDLAYKFSSN